MMESQEKTSDNIATYGTDEQLYKVLVIGDFGVGTAIAS